MPTKSRRKNPSIIERLLVNPKAFSFFQAVRILERASQIDNSRGNTGRTPGADSGIGGFAPPAQEAVRLRTAQSLRFPESELQSVERASREKEPARWQMRVAFMGLTGAMGVMPFHYTELALQRLKRKDEALSRFLDLFNHRTLSLFHRAATKYRLPLAYEGKRGSGNGPGKRDGHTQALLSLLGLGTKGLSNRLQVADESLVNYAGLFTQQVRTSSGLKQILEDYFQIPVQIQEFLGQWEELIPDARSRLASRSIPKGQNAELGHSLIFGKKGWFAQGKFRVLLGPLNKEQFNRFAPNTSSLKKLNEIVRLYVGLDKDYDFVIEVSRRDIPERISLGSGAKPMIGWNTWLSASKSTGDHSNDTFKIRISANRLA